MEAYKDLKLKKRQKQVDFSDASDVVMILTVIIICLALPIAFIFHS